MRLLEPTDYGLLGMAMVFIGFAGLFKQFGLSAALIQDQDVTPLQESSVFWLNLLAGVLLTTLFYVTAPLVAAFYRADALTEVVQLLSLTFTIGAVGIVPQALLKKAMAFDALAKIQIASVVVSGPVALVMAFQDWGVWSLVAQNLIGALAGSLLVWMYAPWRPSFSFSWQAVKSLLQYGANLTGFSVVNYWSRQGDDVLIGRYIGTAELGIYTRAYSLMLLPITQIISVIQDVMFAALSSIQEEKERVRRVYLLTMRILSFITFPMMLGLIVVAEPLVLAVFGTKWAGVIPIIQILSLVGIVQTLANPTGWIYTSQGRTDWMFRWGLGASSVIIGAIVFGVWVGTIEAVAWAYLAANVILLYPCITIPGSLINMSFADVATSVWGNLAVASTMVALVYLISQLLPPDISRWGRLAVEIPAGVVIYGGLAYFLKLRSYREVRDLAFEQWDKYVGVSDGL